MSYVVTQRNLFSLFFLFEVLPLMWTLTWGLVAEYSHQDFGAKQWRGAGLQNMGVEKRKNDRGYFLKIFAGEKQVVLALW